MLTVTVSPAPRALQSAIDALPPTGDITLRLLPGLYREKVVLERPHTTIEGEGATLLWDDAARTILEDGMKRGTFRTATLLCGAEHVTLRGLTVVNAAAPREEAGQAIALYVDGDHFRCEGCTLRSLQDTLFTAPLPPKEIEKNGFVGPRQFAPRTPQRHLYLRCRIEGDVDFIFGGAAAWFEDCDIVSRGEGYATAASTPEGQRYGYVFSGCRFLSEGAPERSVYLGRPWREFARTVLLACELGEHIRPEGWHDWGKSAFHTRGDYAEYACTGPGAQGERAAFARRLTPAQAAAITREDLLRSL